MGECEGGLVVFTVEGDAQAEELNMFQRRLLLLSEQKIESMILCIEMKEEDHLDHLQLK